MTEKIPDLRGWHPAEHQAAARELADKIDHEALNDALGDTLPGYRHALVAALAYPDENSAAKVALAAAGTAVYADVLSALCDLLAHLMIKETRPSIAVVRRNLEEMQGALAALSAAWGRADIRTKDLIYRALGEPEAAPLPVRSPSDGAWDRGVDRILKFNEGAGWIADRIEKATAALPAQDFRSGDYDAFVARLGDLFTAFTKLPFTTSDNTGNALNFIAAASAVLPKPYAPSRSRLGWSVRRVVRERRK